MQSSPPALLQAAAPPRPGLKGLGDTLWPWGRAPAVRTAVVWGSIWQRQGWEKGPVGVWAPPNDAPQSKEPLCTPMPGSGSSSPSPGEGRLQRSPGLGAEAGPSPGLGHAQAGGLPPTAAGHLPLPSSSPSSLAPLPWLRASNYCPAPGGGWPRQVSWGRQPHKVPSWGHTSPCH